MKRNVEKANRVILELASRKGGARWVEFCQGLAKAGVVPKVSGSGWPAWEYVKPLLEAGKIHRHSRGRYSKFRKPNTAVGTSWECYNAILDHNR
jgi:hypothetical protein